MITTKIDLFSTVSQQIGLALNKMLINVTNTLNKRQFLTLTCFIIHVGLECIGENAYAWRTTR